MHRHGAHLEKEICPTGDRAVLVRHWCGQKTRLNHGTDHLNSSLLSAHALLHTCTDFCTLNTTNRDHSFAKVSQRIESYRFWNGSTETELAFKRQLDVLKLMRCLTRDGCAEKDTATINRPVHYYGALWQRAWKYFNGPTRCKL